MRPGLASEPQVQAVHVIVNFFTHVVGLLRSFLFVVRRLLCFPLASQHQRYFLESFFFFLSFDI